MDEDRMLLCAVCNSTAPHRCSVCKQVAYCSKDHQKAHWKVHKPQCRPFEIRRSEELGRYLVSSREIPEDSLLISEGPLVVGPKLVEPLPQCLGCYRLVDPSFSIRCPTCHWPACSPSCPGLQDPHHHLLECILLSKNTDLADQANFHYEAIIVLRCLLLQKRNPQKFNDLMSMESHMNKRGDTTEVFKEMDERIVKYLYENFFNRCDELPLNDVSPELLHTICAILDVNGLEVSTGISEMLAVYSTVCILEHSCIPNTRHIFQEDGTKIKVFASVDIQKGEHLSTMYTHALWGTVTRRGHLKANKYFSCQCIRCSDPTELGTHFSTLRCIGVNGILEEACGHWVLPIDPLNENADWKCEACPVILSAEQVADLSGRIAMQVDQVLEAPDVNTLEQVIENLEQLLHKHHYHCFILKHSLMQLYGRQPGFTHDQLSESQLQRKIDLCNELLEVTRVFDRNSRRLALYTTVAMFELHLALLEFYNRKSDAQSKLALLREAQDLLTKCSQILSDELPFSAGFEMNNLTKHALSKVNKLLENSNRAIDID